MPFPADTPESSFARVWGGGYVESRQGYEPYGGGLERVEELVIARFREARPAQILEIGCGGLYWTRKLALIAPVITLDLSYVPRPEIHRVPHGVTHIVVPEKSFNCHGVADESVDAVFSFGLFCHLSKDAQTEYLRNVRRVLRPGGIGIVMFANCDRHQCMEFDDRFLNQRMDGPEIAIWFACNEEIARAMVEEAGLVGFRDLTPWFRDTVAEFRKP